MHLPLTVDEVTPEWLSEALSSGDHDVTVTGLQTTSIVWGTATKVLVEVDYAAGNGTIPRRLCVKGGFVPELRAVMAPGYATEARFYRDVAPMVGNGLPSCHFAATDGEQSIVVLDDLVAAGATFCDAREPLTVEQVGAGLDVLAALHARTDVDFDWLDAEPYIRPMLLGLLDPVTWEAAADGFATDAVRELLADRERVADALPAMLEAEDARPATVVHGDANLTNVFLTASGAPRFADWQFACRSDPAQDVALFMIGALTIEDRRAHEEELLRGYLRRRGGSASFDELWRAYREQPMHGAMYALTPEEMQPANVRAALAERYAQAALDHHTLRLLGA